MRGRRAPPACFPAAKDFAWDSRPVLFFKHAQRLALFLFLSSFFRALRRAAAEDLSRVLPEWARFDVEEAVQLACRVNVNAHGLRDDSGSNLVIGVGLFPLTAMINHSCRPNCAFVYHGETDERQPRDAAGAG